MAYDISTYILLPMIIMTYYINIIDHSDLSINANLDRTNLKWHCHTICVIEVQTQSLYK